MQNYSTIKKKCLRLFNMSIKFDFKNRLCLKKKVIFFCSSHADASKNMLSIVCLLVVNLVMKIIWTNPETKRWQTHRRDNSDEFNYNVLNHGLPVTVSSALKVFDSCADLKVKKPIWLRIENLIYFIFYS